MKLTTKHCLYALAALVTVVPATVAAEPHTVEAAASENSSPPAVAEPTSSAKVLAAPVVQRPAVTLQAKVDLTRQVMTVIENGRMLAAWTISSGVEDHATPRGTFQPEWTAKMWYSHTYDNAPMPNAVFFKDGAAVHATQSVGALGRAASHGCVRLAPAHADTFYKLVQKHGLAHTRIAVFGTPAYSRPQIAQAPAVRAQRAVAVARVRNEDGGLLSGLFGNPAPTVTFVSAPGRSSYPPLRVR